MHRQRRGLRSQSAWLAAGDAWRSSLYQNLVTIHRTDLFPVAYRNQTDLARSLLAASRSNTELADIQFVGKRPVQFKETKGIVYFFKYKVGKDDDWQIGLSGLQPLDPKEVNTANEFVSLTGKKLRPGTPVNNQFDEQLKKLLFSRRKSAVAFYLDNNFNDRAGEED